MMMKRRQLNNTHTSLNIMLRSPSAVVPLSTFELTPKHNHQHNTDKVDTHAGKAPTQSSSNGQERVNDGSEGVAAVSKDTHT